eukprot:TRINITY_DN7120_c0_g1_i1.p3 TRINITY_DN7120_c0_g1~~TRINITY_DN7120_c0_g1_i1.p3  ORF type:complete len:173 (+),score=27.32 TRINITY_DN7120_c0_g1_i1:720-1238(+)
MDNGLVPNTVNPAFETHINGQNVYLYGILRSAIASIDECQSFDFNRGRDLPGILQKFKDDVHDHFLANLYLGIACIVFFLLALILKPTEKKKPEDVKKGLIGLSTIMLVLFHLMVLGILINYIVEIFRQYDVVLIVRNHIKYWRWVESLNCFQGPGVGIALRNLYNLSLIHI